MFYSKEPEALRAFLRDKLGFPANDIGGGWLIFDLPEADMGVHPAGDGNDHGEPNGTHDISFYCDDIESTKSELEERGVEFASDIVDMGFGFGATFKMPGDMVVQLYQPRYPK